MTSFADRPIDPRPMEPDWTREPEEDWPHLAACAKRKLTEAGIPADDVEVDDLYDVESMDDGTIIVPMHVRLHPGDY